MSGRRRAEGVVFATIFALTAILPAALILVTIGSLFLSGNEGYDDSLGGLIRGIARDIRDSGASGIVPAAVLLLGLGFGARAAIRRRAGDALRIVSVASAGAVLAGILVLPHPLDLRAVRITIVLGAAGLCLAYAGAGWAAWRATRRAATR